MENEKLRMENREPPVSVLAPTHYQFSVPHSLFCVVAGVGLSACGGYNLRVMSPTSYSAFGGLHPASIEPKQLLRQVLSKDERSEDESKDSTPRDFV
jgi:hypothetical protein